MVRDWAVGTLQEWLNKSYSEHLSDERQRRVVLWDDGTYVVQDFAFGIHPDRKFKVTVVVEEVT
jgi:hypothetical protein